MSVRNNWVPVSTQTSPCFSENLNYLYTFSGDRYLVDNTTLDEVEELLDPKIFYRANRQFIVNIEAIKQVKPMENQKLILYLKTTPQMEVDISREKAPAFKKWFDR
ncbi:MAG: LytTR family DNA-binding domain-containing protein [Saprospiraceae bacterium]